MQHNFPFQLESCFLNVTGSMQGFWLCKNFIFSLQIFRLSGLAQGLFHQNDPSQDNSMLSQPKCSRPDPNLLIAISNFQENCSGFAGTRFALVSLEHLTDGFYLFDLACCSFGHENCMATCRQKGALCNVLFECCSPSFLMLDFSIFLHIKPSAFQRLLTFLL